MKKIYEVPTLEKVGFELDSNQSLMAENPLSGMGKWSMQGFAADQEDFLDE